VIFAIEGRFDSANAEKHFKNCQKCKNVLNADKAEFDKEGLVTV
jgi:hypothetical protein